MAPQREWLEKDYYHNRYGDKWVSHHLETFFKKGLVPNDPNKVVILPVDAPHSGNMLDMLSSAAMPHLLRGSHGPRSACDSSAYRMSRVSSPKDASTAGTLEAFSAA